jgi:hypothetical protein
MDYKGKIESLCDDLHDRLNELGEIYRREVIAPFCEKYGLNFVSGMGSYFFSDKNLADYESTPIYWVEGVDFQVSLPHKSKLLTSKRFAKQVKAIFEVLDLEIARNDYFGFYVGDVR